MAEDTYSFEQARVRLEEIASQVKRKDTSLEKSLDLLEEGVRLANLCTEQIDQTQWRSVETTAVEGGAPGGETAAARDAGDVPQAEAADAPAAATDVAGPEDDGGDPGLDADAGFGAYDTDPSPADAAPEDPALEA